MTTSGAKFLIIACDGGGIRGLIPSMLLQRLYQTFPTLPENVYLYAGTSTGGIISLALACNISPVDLVSMYTNLGGSIFQPSSCMSATAATKPKTVAAPTGSMASTDWWAWILEHLEELICTWYTNTGLQSTIESKLGASANWTLEDIVNNTFKYVLVNTFQLCNDSNVWTPLQLTNLPNSSSAGTYVIDAAMSTSAAPMYFPPYNHPTYGYCIDGGMFANNPGTVAITSLLQSDVPLENIWMISLSTGLTSSSIPASTINDFGINECGPLFWFFPIPNVGESNYTPSLPLMNVIFDGTSAVDAFECQQLLGTRYVRSNVPLSQPIALDDYSPTAIKEMTNSTNNYMQSSQEWANIIAWVQANFVFD